MPNVFLTPTEIRDSIKEVFIQAQFEGAVRNGVFTLKCAVSERVPDFYIEKAINALTFVPALKDLYARTVMLSHCQPKEHFKLDVERFSLVPPLSNWKLFQRRLFQENGRDVEDLIIGFLTQEDEGKQETANLLEQMGLKPEQIGEHIQEEDREILVSLCEKINKQPRESSARLFSLFKRAYPLIGEELEHLFIEREKSNARMTVPPEQTRVLKALKGRVVGQDEASNVLCSAICSKDGKNKRFLFVGPTGTGKTEMSKAVACMNEGRFLMLAMNTYSQSHSVSNLFGSPVGYVGSSDKPAFIKMIENHNPKKVESSFSENVFEVEKMVVLFDELEKAAPEVKQSLLTLFDEGFITCTYTSGSMMGSIPFSRSNISEKYIFKNSIFIGTSNLFSSEILRCFRERKSFQETQRVFSAKNAESSMYSSFSPEFLGRFSVVPFGPIPKGKEHFQKIIKQNMHKALATIENRNQLSGFDVEREETVLEIMEDSLYGNGIGIRRVHQYFDVNLNTVIDTKILTDIDPAGKTLVLFPYNRDTIGVRIDDIVLGESRNISGIFPIYH